MTDATVTFIGWSSSSQSWGGGPWGQDEGLPAATGTVGTVSVDAASDAPATGLAATASVGDVTVTSVNAVSVTGVAATGGVGSASVGLGARVIFSTGWNSTTQSWGGGPWGQGEGLPAATGSSGTVSVVAAAGADVNGLEATASVGAVTVTAPVSVNVTGIAATGSVGTASTQTDNRFEVTGVQATGQVGSVTVTADAIINVTGVYATGVVGPVLVYGRIIPDQDPNWKNIAA